MIGFYKKPHLCILEIKGTFNFWIEILVMYKDRDIGSTYTYTWDALKCLYYSYKPQLGLMYLNNVGFGQLQVKSKFKFKCHVWHEVCCDKDLYHSGSLDIRLGI